MSEFVCSDEALESLTQVNRLNSEEKVEVVYSDETLEDLTQVNKLRSEGKISIIHFKDIEMNLRSLRNPKFEGKPLKKIAGRDLQGYFAVYCADRTYRIVYTVVDGKRKVTVIGRRETVYSIAESRK